MGAFNIPLMVDTPQFKTQNQAEGQVLGLKQLANSVKMQGQQEKLNDLRVKEEEIQINESKARAEQANADREEAAAADELFRKHKGDIDEMIKDAPNNPKIRPATVQGWQTKAIEYKKNALSLDAATREKQMARNEQFGQGIRAVRSTLKEAGPGAAATLFTSEIQRALKAGLLTPEEAEQAKKLDPTDDKALETYEYGLRGADIMHKTAKEEADKAEVKRKRDAEQRLADRVEFSTKYQAALLDGTITDQASHDAFLKDETPESIKSEVYRHKVYDPTRTPEAMARMGRTPAQQIEYEKSLKPTRDPNPTEASLALAAAGGDEEAQKALDLLVKQAEAKRAPKDPKDPKEDPDEKPMTDAQRLSRQKEARKLADDMAAMEVDNRALNQLLEGSKGRLYDSKSIKFKGKEMSVEEGRALVDQNMKEYNRLKGDRDVLDEELTGDAEKRNSKKKAGGSDIDPSMKESKGVKIGQTITWQGKTYKVKGFNKAGNIIPE